jgi:hypothetical protein
MHLELIKSILAFLLNDFAVMNLKTFRFFPAESFHIKYGLHFTMQCYGLNMKEMFWFLVDSRGMQICPESDKLLKIVGEKSVKKKPK